MSNRQKALQTSKQKPSTSYIPIQNIFATSEVESRKLVNAQKSGAAIASEYTGGSKKVKKIQVFVESNIEFAIDVPDDPSFTCGWLQAEVARKYYEVLEKQAYEMQ